MKPHLALILDMTLALLIAKAIWYFLLDWVVP